MSESHFNGQVARKLRDTLRRSAQRKRVRQLAQYSFALMLLLWVMLAMGCASKPQIPCEPLPPTPPYVLTQPLPSQSYLLTAQQRMESWLKRLNGTPSTSKP